jgi:hypothetical protein
LPGRWKANVPGRLPLATVSPADDDLAKSDRPALRRRVERLELVDRIGMRGARAGKRKRRQQRHAAYSRARFAGGHQHVAIAVGLHRRHEAGSLHLFDQARGAVVADRR